MGAVTDLVAVPSHLLTEAWPEVGPFLESMASNSDGKFLASDYAKAVVARDMQLWAALKDGVPTGVALTEILNYPRQTVGRFVGANGKGAGESAAHIEVIERWAKINKVARMEIICAPGWEFHLRKFGYKRTHVLVEKAL